MANLQATKVTSSLDVQQNTYIKLGQAYVSSGGAYAHFSQNAWYNGSAWQGGGGTLQITSNTLNFYKDPATSAATPMSISETSVKFVATNVTLSGSAVKVGPDTTSGNSPTNPVFGIGAAAGANAADGKVLVNAGGTSKPFLEVTNCGGNGSTSTSTFSVFKGYLAVRVGANVGPATSVSVGTHYLRLWNNA